MSKSKSYNWQKTGKKSWVFSKKSQDNKSVCTPRKQTGYLLKLMNGLTMKTKAIWTWITSAVSRSRIQLAAWIIGINKYQMSHAILLLTNTPIYVPEKNEGNRNAKSCRGKGDCQK
jgi:hypothetical protein